MFESLLTAVSTRFSRRGIITLGIAALLTATFVASCGGDSKETSATPAATTAGSGATPGASPANPRATAPTPVVQGPIPSGWKRFEIGGFTGAVPDAWLPLALDFSSANLNQQLPNDIPASVRTALTQLAASGNLTKVFVVYVDFNSAFATNINALACEGPLGTALAKDTNALLSYYKANGIQAQTFTKTTYQNASFDVIKANLSPAQDTYQTYLRSGECYFAVTLSTRPGDTSAIENFKTFTSLLSANPAKLGTLTGSNTR